MSYSPTVIDLSRIPAPNAIEPLNPETLIAAFKARFVAVWDQYRAKDPTLPAYDVASLEFDPVVVAGEAFSYFRLLDRARVNAAVKGVLAPFAKGTDLDNIVAGANLERLIVVPANPVTGAAAVYETDAQLLNRYLLSFDKPSAGSAAAYLSRAFAAWPGMHDAAVIGRAVHGRRGDVDLVVIGPGGRLATSAEISAVRAAVDNDHAKPEATSVVVINARRAEYALDFEIEVGTGPDASIVADEAAARILAVTAERTAIGAGVPASLTIGAAYGPNVLVARDLGGFAGIPADPYTIPVCTSISVRPVVRT
ncbi:baseplate J/gp47 family protein [Microvirga sp. Mcv34]|uniref:baseplate J/gp47 family protein n=1 Tax=Microvirga sp. Mcv34 TaxID=2926016 RepID=UPI0021C9F890|nr:baseplate J/gp47 family protein [Microvirga sp. Mcv34]